MNKIIEPMLRMMKSNQGRVVAISAVLAGLAITYSVLTSNNSSSENGNESEPEVSVPPALSEEQVIRIMTDVMDRVKSLTCTTMHIAKKTKEDMLAEGESVDIETLRQVYILPSFEKGYQDILNFVHNEYDVDKAEVQSALTYYRKAGSKELIALHESISKVFIMFGGCMDAESEDDEEEDDEEDNEDEEIPDEDAVLRILGILAHEMVGHTIRFAEEFKRKYGLPNSSPDLMEAFLTGITTLSEEAEKLVLKQNNLTMQGFKEAFHTCTRRGSPAIDKAVLKMKTDNKALLRSQGIVI